MNPDDNQNRIVQVLLFVFMGMFIANTVGQFLGIDYKEPWYLGTMIIPLITTVLYAYYKRHKAPLLPEKVLLIESNSVWISLVTHTLKTDPPKYKLVVIRSVQEALDYLDECEIDDLPDHIILDLAINGIGGSECLLRIKKNPKTETIPITILNVSAQPMTDEEKEAASSWVSKIEGQTGVLKGLELSKSPAVEHPKLKLKLPTFKKEKQKR